MTIRWNLILQAVATTLHTLNASGMVFSAKGQVIVAAVLGGLQILISGLAQYGPSPADAPVPVSAKPLGVLLLLFLLLGGCASAAGLVEALAKDQATGCAKVTTVWGTVEAARTNISAGDVTCHGLKVSAPGAAVLPVIVRPVAP